MSSAPAPRALTLPTATALVVGQVIAVGIFLTPGTIIRALASPLWVLGLWAVMGGMAICGALVYGALAARFPQAGGGYVYLREAYGPRVAFLYGWKCLLVMDPGITAALATGFAAYVAYLQPLSPLGLRLVAIAPIAIFAAIHVTGIRLGARVLGVVALLKVLLVVGLTIAAFASPAASWSHFTPFAARAAGAPPLAGALAGAFVAAFFSFGGWWEVTKIAGEVSRPSWTLPRALVAGLVVVTACYALATMAFVAVVPIGNLAAGEAVVAQVGDAIFGHSGGTIVAGIVIVCVLGSLGGMQSRRVSTWQWPTMGCSRGQRRPCIRASARRHEPSSSRPASPRCSSCSAPSTASSPTSSSRRWRSSPPPSLASSCCAGTIQPWPCPDTPGRH